MDKTLDGGLFSDNPAHVAVGIDPSLTGFAMTVINSTTGSFYSWMHKDNARGVQRLINIQDWMRSKFEEIDKRNFTVSATGIEDGVVNSHSAFILGELAAAVKIGIYNYFLKDPRFPTKIPPTMVKKYATDKGNAKKNEVLLAVYKKWGIEFTDDNLADSYVIARMTANMCTTVYEKDILDKLANPKFRDYSPLLD